MTLGLQLNSFMMKYLEIRCIIHEEYQEEYLNIKIKISGKIFQVFTVIRLTQPLHIKNLQQHRGVQLNKTSHHVIHLVKEIGGINKHKIEQEIFFI